MDKRVNNGATGGWSRGEVAKLFGKSTKTIDRMYNDASELRKLVRHSLSGRKIFPMRALNWITENYGYRQNWLALSNN